MQSACSTSSEILTALNEQTNAWKEGFLGYLNKRVTIHDNPFSYNRNRGKHDDWLEGRRTARKWIDG